MYNKALKFVLRTGREKASRPLATRYAYKEIMKPIIILIFTLLGMQSAYASQRDALILKFLEVTGEKEAIELMSHKFEVTIIEQLKSFQTEFRESMDSIKKEEIKEIHTRFNQKVSKTIRERFNWERLKDELIVINSEYFTDNKMKEIISFFQTYAGKRYLEQGKKVSSRAKELGERAMLEIRQSVKIYTQEMQSDLKVVLEK